MNKERKFWINLLLAIPYIPIATLAILVPLTLIGALDNAITKIQLAGHSWWLLIILYTFAFLYLTLEPKLKIQWEREKVVNGLILYFKDQLEKRGEKQPSSIELNSIHDSLMERLKIWVWFNPKLWKEEFPNEEYPKYLFGIVDNYIDFIDRYKKDPSVVVPQ